jgi:hypothetical protein
MHEAVLGAEATVEMIRAMRAVGRPPSPSYVAELVETVGALRPELQPDDDGLFRFEIFSPPLNIAFTLSAGDFDPLCGDEDDSALRRRRERTREIFAMLDVDTNTPTIADKGRIAVRLATPRDINAEGLDHWNELVSEIEADEWVPQELTTRLRTYVLDLAEQVGYRIALNRVIPFIRGDICVPALAHKKVMVVTFSLLVVDGQPVALSEDTAAISFWLDAEGRADRSEQEQMEERTIRRAFSGQHVSYGADKVDQIRNADLFTRNKRFDANDHPAFFDDLVCFEVLGEKVARCKAALPRAKRA